MERGKEAPFKFFNLRVLPLIALFFILGIFTVSVSYAVAAISFAVAAIFLFLLVMAKSLRPAFAIALFLVAAVGYGSASAALYYRNNVGASGYVHATCRVNSVEETEDGYLVTADRLEWDGERYSGGVEITTVVPVEAGDRLTVSGNIEITELSLDDAFEALKYRTGTKYSMVAVTCVAEPGNPPLADRIRTRLRETLIRYEGDTAGAFTYAMIVGDASYLGYADKANIRALGAAHIFAVSGLHVGVFAAVLLFILRKCRANRIVRLVVMAAVLGAYAYLVGFTPSVLRASVMILLSLLASLLGMRYDDLSSVSFAALAILLVKPLYLFDLSFIMSFLSILGIMCFSRPLERACLKRKVPPFFAAGLALSVSSTVALLPVTASVFGTVSLLGVLVNVVVVPLASLAYVLSVIALPLTLLYSGFGALLKVVANLPLGIIEICRWANGINITGSHAFYTWELILYYAVLLLVGKYSLLDKKTKILLGGSFAGIFGVLFFVV